MAATPVGAHVFRLFSRPPSSEAPVQHGTPASSFISRVLPNDATSTGAQQTSSTKEQPPRSLDAGCGCESSGEYDDSHLPFFSSDSYSMEERVPNLYTTPVLTVAIAGASSLIAVVFDMRSTATTAATAAAPLSLSSEVQQSDYSAALSRKAIVEQAKWARDGVPLDAECRRRVYLFDARTNSCLATLYFNGSPIQSLLANEEVLIAASAEMFHMVQLRTLRYVRQQSMYKPLNLRSILALSCIVGPMAGSATSGETAVPRHYCVAYPQSTHGSQGDVAILTFSIQAATPGSAQTIEQTPPSSCAVLHGGTATSGVPVSPAAMQVLQSQRTIPAHHHPISILSFSSSGRILATASELGSTVKLFDCGSGHLLMELQRGHRPATIQAVAVCGDGAMAAALSSNGTLHIFDCAEAMEATQTVRGSYKRGTGAATPASKLIPFSQGISTLVVAKLRAVVKRKVPFFAAGVGSTGGAATAAALTNLHYCISFTEDQRSVWVAEVQRALPLRYDIMPVSTSRRVGMLVMFSVDAANAHADVHYIDI